ncbi:MAG TPA: group I intron-associated PD-(D/E)XK endonuclease [Terriglobales bacterium]|nr:group I intron-associated PD-(D/E)XK endonuclease [Terriglobales bacterium]
MPRSPRLSRSRARPTSARKSTDQKRNGEVAELCFAHRAAQLGLIVSKPYGDSAPYDFVVEGGGKLRRVQVKSASVVDGNSYHVNAGHGASNKRQYGPRQVDVLAAYVAPEEAWYLIPREKLGGRKTIRMAPHREGNGRLERFRERWTVLGAPQRELTLETCELARRPGRTP